MVVLCRARRRAGGDRGRFRHLPTDEGDLPELVLTGAERNINRLTLELDVLSPVTARGEGLDPADLSVLSAEVAAIAMATLGDIATADLDRAEARSSSTGARDQTVLDAAAQARSTAAPGPISGRGRGLRRDLPRGHAPLPHRRRRGRGRPAAQRHFFWSAKSAMRSRRSLQADLHAPPQRRAPSRPAACREGSSDARPVLRTAGGGLHRGPSEPRLRQAAGHRHRRERPRADGPAPRHAFPACCRAKPPLGRLPCAPYTGPDAGLFAVPPVGAARLDRIRGRRSRLSHLVRRLVAQGRRARSRRKAAPGKQPTKVLKTDTGLNIALDDDSETAGDLRRQRHQQDHDSRARDGRIEIKATSKVVVEAPPDRTGGRRAASAGLRRRSADLPQPARHHLQRPRPRRRNGRSASPSHPPRRSSPQTPPTPALLSPASEDRIGSHGAHPKAGTVSNCRPTRSRAEMDGEFVALWNQVNDIALPDDPGTVEDRRLIFVAIARGMLDYLQRPRGPTSPPPKTGPTVPDRAQPSARIRLGVTRMSGRHLRFPFTHRPGRPPRNARRPRRPRAGRGHPASADRSRRARLPARASAAG